jgi:hypothetical protein
MRDAGVLEQLSFGLCRLAELPPLGAPDLVTVARKVPAGVICLISALVFHELTTQIPHAVYIALARGATPPRLDYPPVQIFWLRIGKTNAIFRLATPRPPPPAAPPARRGGLCKRRTARHGAGMRGLDM